MCSPIPERGHSDHKVEDIIFSLNLKGALKLISYDEFSVVVMFDLICDSDISVRRWIYSMYEAVI